MITYKWVTDPCDCVISEDGMANIIQTVHWKLIGSDENGVSSMVYGAQGFPPPSSSDFIPFDQCYQSVVVGWLSSVLDVPALEQRIADAIYLINNPVIAKLNLPVNPEEEEEEKAIVAPNDTEE